MPYNPNGQWTSKEEGLPPELAKKFGGAARTVPESQEVLPEGDHTERKIFIWLIAGAIVIVALASYYFIHLAQIRSVSVSLNGPPTILVGDPFTITAQIKNPSKQTMTDATLSLQLPPNVFFVGEASSTNTLEVPIASIAPSSTAQEDFALIAAGNPQGVLDFTATLNASAANHISTTTDILIGGPAIGLTIQGPANTISGVPMTFTLSYANKSADFFGDVLMDVAYPPAFVLATSSVPLTNGVWNVGPLPSAGAASSTGSMTITGTLVTSSTGQYDFGGSVNAVVSGTPYLATNQTADVTLSQAPLSLAITANGSSSYVTQAGDAVIYTLTYENNSSITFQGVHIAATFSGTMFEPASVESVGSLNSLTNTITWSPASVPALADIPPGASGAVEFHIRINPSFPLITSAKKNYMVAVTGNISSPTVPPGIVATSTSFATTIMNDVGGSIAVAAEGFHFGKIQGTTDEGPYPPKVNQSTQYTIKWLLTNQATDAQNVTVSATLPPGVTFTDIATSTLGDVPQYNPENDVVSWQIPLVSAGNGVSSPSAQATFQIAYTPSLTDAGQSVPLLGATSLSATDAFTELPMEASSPTVTSNLPHDPRASAVGGTVQSQ